MDQIRKDFSSFQQSDWLILTIVTAVFLPYVISMGILACVVTYLFFKGHLIDCIKQQRGARWIYSLLVISSIISIIYQNWQGLLMLVGFFGLFSYTSYYEQKTHPKLLAYIIEWSLLLSIVVNIVGLFQFNYVSHLGGYSFFDFEIQNSPKRRITGSFQNANIYALMLEYMLACCLYRFLQTKRWSLKVWYVCLALFEFGMVLLTGCRAALVPLIFVIPVQLIFTGQKKLLITYFICLIGLFVAIYIHPSLIPRIDDISTIESRIKIWKTGLKIFKDYPIFGNGPWTYNLKYAMYHGHKAVHCHNIYLDSLVSYGIVGTILFIGWLKSLFQHIFSMRKKNTALYSLMMSILLIICIHGLVDGTLVPIKTNLFALMIFMAV